MLFFICFSKFTNTVFFLSPLNNLCITASEFQDNVFHFFLHFYIKSVTESHIMGYGSRIGLKEMTFIKHTWKSKINKHESGN